MEETMNPCASVTCELFPCVDVKKEGYVVPQVEIDPEKVRMVMISEAAPARKEDHYYASGTPAFQDTTLLAFNDAGIKVNSIKDLLDMGIYFTTAVKCAKTGYGIETGTIKECSKLLEQELALFPSTRVLMLMGDIAIKAVNAIAARKGEGRVIPAGSTYKIRGKDYHFRDMRVFPSYLQVGPSFNIEKSKRRMIAEDIAAAMQLIQ
jgi:uracil-DNA glycosylase